MLLIRPPIEYRGADFFVSVTEYDPGPGLLGPSVGEPNLVREPNDFAGALPTVLFSAYEPGPGVNMLLVLMFVRDLIE